MRGGAGYSRFVGEANGLHWISHLAAKQMQLRNLEGAKW